MKNKKIFKILFYLYSAYLFVEMFNSGRIANAGAYSYIEKIRHCCNFIPFAHLGTIYSMFKSFIMYIPVAVLGRYAFEYLESGRHFIVFIILFITAHDVIQVVTLKGYFDINHIIIGSIGAIIAYYLVEILRKYIPRQTEIDQK